jgi:hypothetical protein
VLHLPKDIQKISFLHGLVLESVIISDDLDKKVILNICEIILRRKTLQMQMLKSKTSHSFIQADSQNEQDDKNITLKSMNALLVLV